MNLLSNGKVRRSESEWREIVERFEQSGMLQAEFCKREGLAASSFQKWRRKFSNGLEEEFVELRPARGKESKWSVELELSNGAILRLKA